MLRYVFETRLYADRDGLRGRVVSLFRILRGGRAGPLVRGAVQGFWDGELHAAYAGHDAVDDRLVRAPRRDVDGGGHRAGSCAASYLVSLAPLVAGCRDAPRAPPGAAVALGRHGRSVPALGLAAGVRHSA